MGKSSISKNYIYNMLSQILSIITPLITMPYIGRVLGSERVGQYGFANSLTTYFVLLASCGYGYYAQREIARFQQDKHSQTKIFWEIVIVRLITVFIAVTVHLLILWCGGYGAYGQLMSLMTINIVAVAWDIQFFFQGNENFGTITIRNFVVRVVGIMCIFVLVRDSGDLWLYVLANCVITICSNISFWGLLPKMLVRVSMKELKIWRHVFPSIRLFLPTIAVSVYTILDRTLIGVIVQGEVEMFTEDGGRHIAKIADVENGYYEQAEKIVRMILTIVASLGTVMIPRNSQEISNGRYERFLENINLAIRFVFFLGWPMMFGIMAVAKDLCPWFLGDGYEMVPSLIIIFSPIIVIIGLSNVLGLQYLLPKGEDGKYTVAVCLGAFSNLILNLFLIRLMGSRGAAIASVFAECIVLSIMLWHARSEIKIKKIFLSNWKYAIASIMMFVPCYYLQHLFPSTIKHTVIIALIGGGIYITFLMLFKDDVLKNYMSLVMKKIRRRK